MSGIVRQACGLEKLNPLLRQAQSTLLALAVHQRSTTTCAPSGCRQSSVPVTHPRLCRSGLTSTRPGPVGDSRRCADSARMEAQVSVSSRWSGPGMRHLPGGVSGKPRVDPTQGRSPVWIRPQPPRKSQRPGRPRTRSPAPRSPGQRSPGDHPQERGHRTGEYRPWPPGCVGDAERPGC
jgi:hypothetical protein